MLVFNLLDFIGFIFQCIPITKLRLRLRLGLRFRFRFRFGLTFPLSKQGPNRIISISHHEY